MPLPSDDQIARMGHLRAPFEHSSFGNRKVMPGEDILFSEYIIDLSDGIIPYDRVVFENREMILEEALPKISQTRYLWIIDESGLKIILESIENPHSERGKMVHTNITGGAKALQGGELWFGTDGRVYLNYKSGRYGAYTPLQREAILEYFRDLGFDVVQIT